jgi:hypothetical protein
VGADENHSPLEAGVANAGHRHQQAAGEETVVGVGHPDMIGRVEAAFKPPIRCGGLAQTPDRSMCVT